MKKPSRFHALAAILSCAILACSTATPVSLPTQAMDNDLERVIAQTAAAAMTQTALVLPSPSATLSPTSEAAFTAADSAAATPSATQFFTTTPGNPMINVSVSTNCRNGPGKVYDYQSALLVGTPVEIFGREASGNYWYIHDPEVLDEQYCWIWGRYATVVGDTTALPMYTPPPTPSATMTSPPSPTPVVTATKKPAPGSFVVSYNNIETCAPNWWADFRLRNNGSTPFQSMKITIKDMTNAAEVFEKTSNVFTDLAGCSTLSEKDVLDPADILLFSGPAFSYDPSGHLLRILLTLCTNNGLNGTCMKQNFDVQL